MLEIFVHSVVWRGLFHCHKSNTDCMGLCCLVPIGSLTYLIVFFPLRSITWAAHYQYPMQRVLCRSHLWRRRMSKWCSLSHSWCIYSCSSLCHCHSAVWLWVCCSASEDDGCHTAAPSPPLMKWIVGYQPASSVAGHDLWQKTQRDINRWTESQHRLTQSSHFQVW